MPKVNWEEPAPAPKFGSPEWKSELAWENDKVGELMEQGYSGEELGRLVLAARESRRERQARFAREEREK
jgi:hypothetical protein